MLENRWEHVYSIKGVIFFSAKSSLGLRLRNKDPHDVGMHHNEGQLREMSSLIKHLGHEIPRHEYIRSKVFLDPHSNRSLSPIKSGDKMRWCLGSKGDIDIKSFYGALRGSSSITFPWKGVKAPRHVFFCLDNYMGEGSHNRPFEEKRLHYYGLVLPL